MRCACASDQQQYLFPACIKSGVSGWAKLGQDTTPFNDYLKDTSGLLSVLKCDMSDLPTISQNFQI